MASRIPKIFSGAVKTTIVEEVVAPSSTKASINMDMASAPTLTLKKKGIPCAPKLSPSSSAAAVPQKPSSMARVLATRLPAPPVRNEGDDAACLKPSKLPTTPDSFCSSTATGVQLCVEGEAHTQQRDQLPAEQRPPCVPGGDDGLSALTIPQRDTHTESGAELSRSSSFSCASGFSSPLSAASSSSLSSSSASLTAITTAAISTPNSNCPSCPGTPGVLSAASSFVERPVAVASTNSSSQQGKGQEEPHVAMDTASSGRCTPVIATSSSSSSSTRCSASVGAWPAPTSVASITEMTEALRLINELYEIYNRDGLRQVQRLCHAVAMLNACASPSKAPATEATPAPAPLALAPVAEFEAEAEDAPTPASPRAPPSEYDGGAKEMPEAAVVVPAEEVAAAKPSGGLKRKLGKVLRGLFGSCAGRNADAL